MLIKYVCCRQINFFIFISYSPHSKNLSLNNNVIYGTALREQFEKFLRENWDEFLVYFCLLKFKKNPLFFPKKKKQKNEKK